MRHDAQMPKPGRTERPPSSGEQLNYLLRALHRALSAALTLLVVNHRNISVHGDCAERTFLRAERTADTARRAGVHDRLTLLR